MKECIQCGCILENDHESNICECCLDDLRESNLDERSIETRDDSISRQGEKLNVLSLFDGISTGRYCLEKAGIQIDNYYSSEINPDAIKISEKHYPDIIRLGDVTTVDARNLPKIDLLIGGSPCQGFSRAGKGLNFEDPRSKLFFEYVRILNEIRAINPNVKFFLENVKNEKRMGESNIGYFRSRDYRG